MQHQESTSRPEYFTFNNGPRAALPFTQQEYDTRLANLRTELASAGVDAAIFTSMHAVAYYSGFLYCAFGRPYAMIVTANDAVTLSANIDGGQPARRGAFDNIVYTDWQRDNYWRAAHKVCGHLTNIGIEADHLTLAQRDTLMRFLPNATLTDIAPLTMRQRMIKSAEEIALIREGARIADHGGFALREAIKAGATEHEIAAVGRDSMEAEIARSFPDSELRDTWVWFQSGLNTDGAHNPLTTRQLDKGDILSLNMFPMINGYYTALERTLFVGQPDTDSLKIWQSNCDAHTLGLSLIKPGATCAGICAELNKFFGDAGLLQYRSFGYGHSFGVLSHYYGREAGLELREDIETQLLPGMVVSMEPMVTIPQDQPGAGGYREHDILVITENGAENITRFPYGPTHNIVD